MTNIINPQSFASTLYKKIFSDISFSWIDPGQFDSFSSAYKCKPSCIINLFSKRKHHYFNMILKIANMIFCLMKKNTHIKYSIISDINLFDRHHLQIILAGHINLGNIFILL